MSSSMLRQISMAVRRSRECRRNATPLALCFGEERGAFGPVFKSSTVTRFRSLGTVLRLPPSSRLTVAREACNRCIAARTTCVVAATPRRTLRFLNRWLLRWRRSSRTQAIGHGRSGLTTPSLMRQNPTYERGSSGSNSSDRYFTLANNGVIRLAAMGGRVTALAAAISAGETLPTCNSATMPIV